VARRRGARRREGGGGGRRMRLERAIWRESRRELAPVRATVLTTCLLLARVPPPVKGCCNRHRAGHGDGPPCLLALS
jgi:hypothetical protein